MSFRGPNFKMPYFNFDNSCKRENMGRYPKRKYLAKFSAGLNLAQSKNLALV